MDDRRNLYRTAQPSMGMIQPQNEAWLNSEVGTCSTGRNVDARTDSHAETDRSPRATIRTCLECDSTDVRHVPTRGEIVCASCGLVVETDEDLPRTLDELADVSRVEKSEIGHTHQYLSGKLDLNLEPVDPAKYVPRFCSALGLSGEIQHQANRIIRAGVEERALLGKSPSVFAAGAIYFVSRLCIEGVTQHDIASAVQVSTVAVPNHYQAQVDVLGRLDGDVFQERCVPLRREDEEEATS